MKRAAFLLILLYASLVPLRGQYRDSAAVRSRRNDKNYAESLRPVPLLISGALFTVGALGVNWSFYNRNINYPAKDCADRLMERYGPAKIDDYLQYLPSAAFLSLGGLGRGGHNFGEHLALGATAWGIMGLSVNALKYSYGDLRPDGSTYNSFPSGHTATAFMGAELVRIEYGGWWGVGAYTVAGVTALLRVYNGRHWVSDLFGGAAIGILSANLAYLLLPFERRLFSVKEASLSIVPFASGTGGAGIALACSF